jgi:type I restriction enzyme R subunit
MLKQAFRSAGIDLEELDFKGTDIERKVTNTGTTDALVREFMDKCRKDALGLPVKSIIFATSHDHAKRLYQSFNKLFPNYQRRDLVEIIDSHMERAEEMLDDFKFKEMPRRCHFSGHTGHWHRRTSDSNPNVCQAHLQPCKVLADDWSRDTSL